MNNLFDEGVSDIHRGLQPINRKNKKNGIMNEYGQQIVDEQEPIYMNSGTQENYP